MKNTSTELISAFALGWLAAVPAPLSLSSSVVQGLPDIFVVYLLILWMFFARGNLHFLTNDKIRMVVFLMIFLSMISIASIFRQWILVGYAVEFSLGALRPLFYLPLVMMAYHVTRIGGSTSLLIGTVCGGLYTLLIGYLGYKTEGRLFYGLPFLHNPDLRWPLGPYGRNTVVFSLVLSFLASATLSFSTRRTTRWLFVIASIIFSVSIFLTFSRGGWLVFLLASAAYLAFHKGYKLRRFKWVGGILGITFSLFLFLAIDIKALAQSRDLGALSSATDWLGKLDGSERWEFYIQGFALTVSNPLLGVGFGGYAEAAAANGFIPTADPHSVWMWLSAEAGLGALVIFLVIFLVFMQQAIALCVNKRLYRNGQNDDFAPLAVAFLVFFMIHSFLSGLLYSTPAFWVVLGFIIGLLGHCSNFWLGKGAK